MTPVIAPSRTSRLLPALLVLFAASGCAALIYEIVWLQLLQLVIGSNAMSIAVLLGTWMGGMCIGSLLLPRLIPAARNALRVYAFLELATGICGILVLFGLPSLRTVYLAGLSSGMPNAALRAICCAVALLPPTILMGATLPLIARWVESMPSATKWWGYFYGVNIAGGVLGCFAAGFYLLRVYDMSIASYVAVAINFAIGLASLSMAGSESRAAVSQHNPRPSPTTPKRPWDVYFTIAISGLTALGAEVVWTRLLSLMLGPTTYTFSIILGVFLAGLGIGSALGSRMAEQKGQPRMLLIGCQILLALAMGWAGFLLADWLPYWQGNLNTGASPWVGFISDIWRSIIPILPGAILWGASFPIALASAAEENAGGDSARVVGEIYGANTVGAILGAVFFSLVFIPGLSLHGSEQLLMVISLLGALALTGLAFKNLERRLIAAFAVAILLAFALPDTPWKLIGFGRRLPTTEGNWNLLYTTDGMNSSIAYSQWEHDTTYFHVTGKVEASTEPQDMSLQRMLGHLPAILHRNPQNILVVGCGAGVTAGSFVVHPEVQHITICEIEPRIPPATAKYFGDANHHVIDDPRTKIVYDDARHYVLTADQKFDIITSDPIHPWVKGMASLYTTEYFEMCKRHLNPGGIVTQWVPLYESSFETVQSELATFFEAFPYGTVWGNLNTDGTGYDVVLMGSVDKLPIDVDAVQTKLADPKYAAVRKSLADVGFPSVLNLLSTFAADANELRGWMRTAQINHDRNLRLQYLAGLGLNQNLGPDIFQQIVSGRKFPNSIFTGSAAAMQPIEQMVGRSFGQQQQ
ncbi:MAG TPA: fused MFS/spermidine synthase [Bryobacteraceae bacterium]|nr:fused MFS/spermidine synthase [Bryobacteraceae bacterium]